MGVFDHAEYDSDIFILIGGLCDQQSKMAVVRDIEFWWKLLTVADNIMQYLNYEVFKVILND